MKSSRGKKMAMIVISLGLPVILAAALSGRGQLIERWYIFRYEHGSVEEQCQAIVELSKRKSTAAIPIFINHLEWELARENPIPSVSLEALARLGPNAIAKLLSHRRSWSFECKFLLHKVMSRRDDLKAAFIPLFLDSLEDPDLKLRLASVEALSEAGAEAVPALLNWLDTQRSKDDVEQLRLGILALGAISFKAGGAVPLILSLVNHDNRAIRLLALEALGKIGQPAQQALPRLRQLAVGDEDFLVRRASEIAVEQIVKELR